MRIGPVIEAIAAAIETTAYRPVYRHRLPSPPTDSRWHRVVVRQLQGAELTERASGRVCYPVQVAAQCSGYDDPNLLLEAAHEALRLLLEELRPPQAYLSITRQTHPLAPVYDEETRSYTSAATYLVVL